MKGRQIVLDRLDGRAVAALLVDGALDDLLIAPPGDLPLPGAIYRGVLDRPMKGQGGATVRLPEGRGYLRQAKGLAPGAPVLVQVAGFAEDGKAVPLTRRLLFKSRYAIATPEAPGFNVSRAIRDEDRRARLHDLAHAAADAGGPHGIIVRSAAEGAEDADVAADIRAMAELCAAVMADLTGPPELLVDGPDPHDVAWRDWAVEASVDAADGAFARHGLAERIEALRGPRFDLPGGAHAFIEPTRALVAVDVNTGGDTSPSAGLKANLAVVRALPAQLRCRGLGGQVVIDAAPMPRKERRNLEQALMAAFRSDPVETSLAGWTPLGHLELQRRRDRLPLARCLP